MSLKNTISNQAKDTGLALVLILLIIENIRRSDYLVVCAITDGQLDFGPWEQIFYGEFDGRRKKRVLVKIIGE